MDELKPCPFCGGKAKLIKRKLKTGFYARGGTYYVHCTRCLVRTETNKNVNLVIYEWNKRINDDTIS